ncbi:site-specific integrase [Asticcacaulis sp. 201]|uniref:site-specific integrase n=1 Tax=Asticcacaulis sp. 201 TaxID=3028787 RepID=UPI00291619B2|nr:site-specific integrase [Asticcacaulis sp. 201]MDV6333167.1 site-specific integrase [Asticcacaulis sp. 201]
METTRHSLMDNRVQIYLRPGSPHWQCSCSVNGQQRRATTKEDSLARAKDVARDWYLGLMGKYQAGELKKGKTFNEVADVFTKEYRVITQGERSERYVDGKDDKIRVHLGPFFGNKIVTEITPGMVQDYRVHRMTSRKDANGKPKRPSRSTLHQEIVTLRQVLKTANRHGWLPYLPDLSTPYKSSGKISHRAWFSPAEYQMLYEATRDRAKKPPRIDDKPAYEDLHDFVLFMVNTGLRPDEAHRLEFRDVAIVTDEPTGERILEIEVRGKRGVGYCKSMPGAVLPFSRLKKRSNGQPADRLFPKFMDYLLNSVLKSIEIGTGPDGKPLNMKKDREGQPRTAYSLRHTYICLRLMEGADIYQIAKNCRTSVEMIEKYYASHIKDRLDASAINVRKPKASAKKAAKSEVENRI